jgi:flagellar hook-associated protein 1
MAGLGDLLNLSGHGLKAYQSQIQVHSQNISNVNTKGYSRRYLEQSTAISANDLGNGVRTGDVVRMFNVLGAAQLLSEESAAGYHAAYASELAGLEMLATGESGGLHSALKDFQMAWQQVTAAPEDLATRTMLLQKGAALAGQFNSVATRLDEYVQGVATDAMPSTGACADTVNDINSLTKRLQTLNYQITGAEIGGRSVPDLLDERDLLVNDLAKRMNVMVGADYRISIGGQELVSANGQSRATLDQSSATTYAVGGVDVTGSITGGSLAGLNAGRALALSMRGELDVLASALASELNALFAGSYNLSGETPASAGYSFFTGTTADTLALDPALYDPADPMGAHPERIAAAATRASAGPPPIPNTGDNSAAKAIEDLLRGGSVALGGKSITDYWMGVETTLAGLMREEKVLAANGEKIVEMLSMRMQEQSGVNLDEELMHLMSNQRAYEACAKLMSTANSLLETLLNMR